MKKIALITEFLCFKGGIEKSILELYNALVSRGIKVDIYAGIYAPDKTFQEFQNIPINYFLKDKLSQALNTVYLRYKFSRLKLKGYNGYIFFGSHSLTAAKNHHPNIWWSTRPLAYLYGENGKVDESAIGYLYKGNPIKKILIKLYLGILRFFDQKDINGVDSIFTVGVLAQGWLKKAYPKREIKIHYAPVDLNKYKYIAKGKYYLNVARHVKDKNVDKIVTAFQNMPDKTLYQVGEGANTPQIKSLADGYKNIKIMGFVEEKTLHNLVGRCIATISACEDEDYSMNMMESVASGKPTISINLDRSVNDIVEIDTGILMPNSSPENIIKAVKMMDIKKAENMKKACIIKSKNFSKENYVEGFLNALK